MHLFMSCVILASDPTLSSANESDDTATRCAELAQGVYALRQAGQKSALATGLMESLTVILNRHKLRVFCNRGRPDCEPHLAHGHDVGGGAGVRAGTGAEEAFGTSTRQDTAGQYFPGATSTRISGQESWNSPEGRISSRSFIPPQESTAELWDLDGIQERVRAEHAAKALKQQARTQADEFDGGGQILSRTRDQHGAGTITDHVSPHGQQEQGQGGLILQQGGFFPSPAETATATDLLPGLDGLWRDLIDAAASSGPYYGDFTGNNMVSESGSGDVGGEGFQLDDGTGFRWDQLFADLDYFVGPS